jgi:hypothetical protein
MERRLEEENRREEVEKRRASTENEDRGSAIMHTVCTHRCEMGVSLRGFLTHPPNDTSRLNGAHLSGLLDFAGAFADGTEPAPALATRDEMSRMRSGHSD